MKTPADLQAGLEGAGQEHVLAFLARLSGEARQALIQQLEAVDLAHVQELGALARQETPQGGESFEPPDLFPLEASSDPEAGEAREQGAELLATGKVGFMLVAGGQASRLGYDAPKGDFPIGPVTQRTLFEYHARRLRAAARRYGVRTPWYVMTSPANDAATRAIFEQNEYYGLPREDVFFFSQEMLPALDTEGRMIFAAPDRLFLAPNGHGGSLLALARSGALADMRNRGIEEISYFQVDNPLVRPADTLFLGLHAGRGCQMSSKVVKKVEAGEKVGVLGRVDGKLGCIEYSDLPLDLREARESSGELAFRAGNIAVHVLRVDFVEELTRAGFELPWHVARKKMRAAAPDGSSVEVDGFKFETFVFDALGRSRDSVTLEVARAQEFSPVKNAEGSDSPASCRQHLHALFREFVARAGDPLPATEAEEEHPIEVDPLFAETPEEFAQRPHRAPRELPGGWVFEEPQ